MERAGAGIKVRFEIRFGNYLFGRLLMREIIALVNMSNCPLQPKICVIEMSVVVGDYLSLQELSEFSF